MQRKHRPTGRSPKRGLRLLGAVGAAAALLGVTAGSAEADYLLGNANGTGVTCGPAFVLAQPGYAVATPGGTITSFQFTQVAANAGQHINFLLLKPLGGGSYTVDATSGDVTLNGSGTISVPVNIAAPAGDVLGLWGQTNLVNCNQPDPTPLGGYAFAYFAAAPSVGATVNLPNPGPGVSVNESATVVGPVIPIGTGGPGSTCDPLATQSNVAQLCGDNFTADAGNPGPYTVASYEDLTGCTGMYQRVYTATPTSVTTNDPTGTPPNAFNNLALGSNPTCTGQIAPANNETGGTANVTGTHTYSTPGTYGVDTTITYSPSPSTRTAHSVATVVGLTVTKTASSATDPTGASVLNGQPLTYVLKVANGASTTSYGNLTVTDVIPNGTIFSSELSSPGCSVAGADPVTGGGTVTCTLADLPAGSSETANVVVLPTVASPPQSVTNGGAVATGTAQVTGGTTTTSAPSGTVTTNVLSSCTTTITTNHLGTIIVPSGTFLCITGATQTGAIDVDPGGALTLTNATVKGGVETDHAVFVTICGSTLPSAGAVLLQGTTLVTRLGDDDANCAGNQITGSVGVKGNTGGVEVFGNTIRGSLSVSDNVSAGPAATSTEVEGNKVGAAIQCTGNVPPPTNDGLVNTAAGGKLNQCRAL